MGEVAIISYITLINYRGLNYWRQMKLMANLPNYAQNCLVKPYLPTRISSLIGIIPALGLF